MYKNLTAISIEIEEEIEEYFILILGDGSDCLRLGFCDNNTSEFSERKPSSYRSFLRLIDFYSSVVLFYIFISGHSFCDAFKTCELFSLFVLIRKIKNCFVLCFCSFVTCVFTSVHVSCKFHVVM